MKNIKQPNDLDRPNHVDQVTDRIAGFIGGGIAGLVVGVFAIVFVANLGFISLIYAFYGLIAFVLLFAILGAFRPKWFAWILDVLTSW
jgi:predicted lipid-binding transport protein (Tim44 family)